MDITVSTEFFSFGLPASVNADVAYYPAVIDTDDEPGEAESFEIQKASIGLYGRWHHLDFKDMHEDAFAVLEAVVIAACKDQLEARKSA